MVPLLTDNGLKQADPDLNAYLHIGNKKIFFYLAHTLVNLLNGYFLRAYISSIYSPFLRFYRLYIGYQHYFLDLSHQKVLKITYGLVSCNKVRLG